MIRYGMVSGFSTNIAAVFVKSDRRGRNGLLFGMRRNV